MEQATVRMNEWHFNQGLVGFKKILERYGEDVKTTSDGIIVEKAQLELLPDAFFDYYLRQYSVANREERIIRMYHKRFKDGDRSVKAPLNQRLNDSKKKVERYYKDTPKGSKLIEVADLYRKERKYVEEMDQWIDDFIQMLHTEEINQKLTANFFKAVHLRPYFGQVSFLNVTHNRKSLEEQREIFRKDFIEPIFEEWQLYKALQGEDEKLVLESLESISHLPHAIKRDVRKKKSVKEMNDCIQQEVHKCSLTDFSLALLAFDEGTFSPLALSIRNAINMTWNSNGKELLPLCSLARLLLFCSQAGATISQGKSVFVYYGGTFDEIYETNQFYSSVKSSNKTFDEIVFDLVREKKLKADYTKKHYLIYEYESDYQAKKTLLDYMVMPPSLVVLFSEHEKLFKGIHYSNKGNLIRLLLRRVDSKYFISNVLREKITNSYSPFEVIQMIQIRHLNQIYAKGEEDVDSSKQRRYVWALVKSAEEVKYRIGEKKAQGIAYRLLNAVRSNNKNTFMDTVMRTYISCDLQMPGLLLEVLHEDKLDFATVGNAWIAGLVSKPNDSIEREEQDE